MIINNSKVKRNHLDFKCNKGLTLIELIVVISIFLVISSTVIFNYGSFRSNVSMQNITDDIAMSIRKAQSFAIGARAAVGGDFTQSYGMHFSTDPTTLDPLNASTKSFLMFYTSPSNKYYTVTGTGACGGATTCLEAFSISTADKIKEIDVTINGTVTVEPAGSTLDIIFSRPDPRAYFCYRATMASSCVSNISSVSIIISNGQVSPNEKTRTISVQNTGQISIQ